ncbi:MAG: citramalate synthase [Candidatus Neomarinimicrobiota bacterium]
MTEFTAIELFDTTLRDGTQGEGISLSLEDKLRITRQLDEFGIDIVEGGWPGSNPRDEAYFRKIRRQTLDRVQICAFGATARYPHAVADDPNLTALLQAETPLVSIFGKTWKLHSMLGLGLDEDANADLIFQSVRHLNEHGRQVIFDAEHFFDGYRDDPDFALAMLEAAVAGGAQRIVLCDTNGGSLPDEIGAVVRLVGDTLTVPLGIHTHDDCNLAVANSLAAVKAGASQVQGTINGVGERCGNANLCSVIPNLVLKMGRATVREIDLTKLTGLSRSMAETMNLRPDNRAAFVGQSAFAHKGGIHVSAVMKDSSLYEHIRPELVGARQRVLISDLSGQSNVRYKARELGISLNGDQSLIRRVVDQVKALEHEGFQFDGADASFELILRKQMGEFAPFFDVLDSRIHVSYSEDGHRMADATLKVRVDGEIEHTAADGVGPVNALNNALRKALLRFYPEIEEVKLIDYKVRVLNEKNGTESKVRVLIESGDGTGIWSTVGVSQNIIEASWQALRDSLNYKLFRSRRKNEFEYELPTKADKDKQ